MAPKWKGPHWEEQARLLEQGIWRSTSAIARRKTRPDKRTRAKEKARREAEAQNPRPTPPGPPTPRRAGFSAASTPSEAVVAPAPEPADASPAGTSSSEIEVEVSGSAASSKAQPSLRLVEAHPLDGPGQASVKPDPGAAESLDTFQVGTGGGSVEGRVPSPRWLGWGVVVLPCVKVLVGTFASAALLVLTKAKQ